MAEATRTVDLGQIRTIILNLESATKRRAHMESLTSDLGLQATFHTGPEMSPGRFGCGLAHLGALLRYGTELPLLVLEDDVKVTEDYRPVFDVPADADMVYLGCSSCGVSPDYPAGVDGLLVCEDIDDDYLRLFNMTAMHAVLYMTPESVQTVVDATLFALTYSFYPHDMEVSLALPKVQAIAPQAVPFYQAAEFQTSAELGEIMERVTRIAPKTPMYSDIVETNESWHGQKLKFALKPGESGHKEWRKLPE